MPTINRMQQPQVPQYNGMTNNTYQNEGANTQNYGQGWNMGMGQAAGRQAAPSAANPAALNYWRNLLPNHGAPPTQQGSGPPANPNQWWNFNGSDPWSNNNFMSNTWQEGLLNHLLQQYGKDGAFSTDYTKLLEPFHEAYQSDYGNNMRRSQLAGASGTMDPSQVALMSRMGQSSAASDASRALSQARLQLMQGSQDRANGLLNSAINWGKDWSMNKQQGDIQRTNANDARGGGGGFGGWIGNVLGGGLGSFAGGFGGGLGRRLGGG